MVSLLVFIILLISINPSNASFGPFFYPNGSSNDTTFITMGAHNDTHFFINLLVTGDYWFGFAFPDDCIPDSGCTDELTPSGCTLPNTALSGCKMDRSDAIIFGNYGGELKLTTLEWTLDGHSKGYLKSQQNIESIIYGESFAAIDTYYSVYITRPYDPSKYGDRFSQKITYPFAGSFCWLWAMGQGITVSASSNHAYAGYQCIDVGGETEAPTPSPSYGPTPGPTSDPTARPSKMPSSAGETAQPSMDPTKEPSVSPTEISANPSTTPTGTPTPGPTEIKGEPTNSPTKKPTPTPTVKPSVSPTPEPTDAPLRPGQTKAPSTDPSLSPTTYEPTPGPTYKPTPSPTFCDDCIDMDPPKSDTSWLQENLTWILSIGVIAAIVCFCGACLCFWCMQKRRTEKRRERRQNLLEVERFKYEQGLNIDAEHRSKQNRAMSNRMAARNKLNALRRGSGGSGSGSGSRFKSPYDHGDGSSTTESDEFFMDDDIENGHGRYRRLNRTRDGFNDIDDEKTEIYVTARGGMNTTGNGDVGTGGRKKKYKPGKGRGRGRTKAGVQTKSKFMGVDDNKPKSVSTRRPRKKYKPTRRDGDGRSSSSDLDSSD